MFKYLEFETALLNQLWNPDISRIKICNSLSFHILVWRSEIWNLRKKDKKRLTSVEKKFFRRTAEYTLFDNKRNDDILEELKAEPVDEKLRRYKSNWLRHVTKMNNSRVPKIMLIYRPNGRRRLGLPLERLLDEPETGLSRPDWYRMMRNGDVNSDGGKQIYCTQSRYNEK